MGTPVTFEMKGIVLLDLGFTSITYKVESSVSFFLEESKKDFFDLFTIN